ncbi:hypothetical protein BDY19DRAFT_910163 [Irpex rosettiformis]|uniref:Uncharacterized protein n=1 Tax=Irpex rosettiformis TaxID=378272 RepID=A0ACB8TPR3_9APHY|nr:hypothetical protein BDY19DRAFT_910163 [Irpex rosettiformis]
MYASRGKRYFFLTNRHLRHVLIFKSTVRVGNDKWSRGGRTKQQEGTTTYPSPFFVRSTGTYRHSFEIFLESSNTDSRNTRVAKKKRGKSAFRQHSLLSELVLHFCDEGVDCQPSQDRIHWKSQRMKLSMSFFDKSTKTSLFETHHFMHTNLGTVKMLVVDEAYYKYLSPHNQDSELMSSLVFQ